MKFPTAKLSSFHNDVLQGTQLGQLCGRQELFRDRYQILRMLGRGGFGVTFLARDVTLPAKPLCVIKQLCPKFEQPSALIIARKRFKREAKILALLGNHSQIPLILDYFVINEEFYLVQEYIRGKTLARLVRRYGPQSEKVVRGFLNEILPVLEYIHNNGVIHRDIKPQNLIRCKDDGRLVLIDFGAVKEQIVLVKDTSEKNSTTHFIGTVGFAAPEQFSLRPVYGSDIYSLGVTCVYLLTGKAPLDLESDRRTGQLRWQNLAQVSESLAQVLEKMLQPSLDNRYISARLILKALNGELPQENLFHCMNIQSRPNFDDLDSQISESVENYTPYAIKTAKAIREWKSRFAAKRLKRQKSEFNPLSHNSIQ